MSASRRDSAPALRFRLFDLLVVVGVGVAATFPLGVIWSYVRIGTVVPVFVREAQFAVAVVALVVWTVRNRSGGPIEEVDDEGDVPLPAPSTRAALYRRLTGADATAEETLGADAHTLALAVALFGLSIGIELVV